MNMKPDWVAVDWDTTHVRAWLMSAAGDVLERRESDKGMGRLERDAFEPTLTALLEDVPSDAALTVVCCGMVGAKQGWVEVPYASVPCTPPTIDQAIRVDAGRLDVRILPGVKQDKPADVMHGEETQIAGFLSVAPDFDGVLCLPGTHNRWVHISAGEIVSFRTFMTGELFDLISTQSVLRHAVSTDGWDQSAFDATLADTLSRPAELATKLFSLRAEGLLHGLTAGTARARLSALLIGAELAAAKPYWLGQEVVILGEGGVATAYKGALAAQGAMVRAVNAEELTLAGLTAAYNSLEKTQS